MSLTPNSRPELALGTEPALEPETTPPVRRRWLRVLGVLAVAFAGSAAAAACASVPDTNRLTVLAAEDGAPLEPDFAIYKASVNEVLERQCGTLDCHGQAGRAYRIYSRSGLRVYNPEAGLLSGITPTTEDEKRYNFQSLITVQPEEMRRVMARGGAEPDNLIILRKPLLVERHKGGQVMSGQTYNCITGWLRAPIGGKLDDNSDKACKAALLVR